MDRLRAIPGIRQVLERVDVYTQRRISRASAQLAYYLVMCLFPVLIVVVSAVGMLPIEGTSSLEQLLSALPDAVQEIVLDYLNYIVSNQSLSLLLVGLAATLLASSAAFQGLIDIFSEVFGHRSRAGIWEKLFTLALSLLLPVILYGALLMVLLGDWLLNLVKFLLDVPVLHYGWKLAQILMPLAVSFLALALVYRLTGPNRACGRRILPGALAASAALVAATKIFSAFMSISTRYTVVYGSLASVIILLVWLFLCSNIMILGNVCNYLWTGERKA